MRPLSAWRDGIRRVNGAPLVLAGMFALTLLVALPLAAVVGSMIEEHLGDSLAAGAVASGNSLDWWQEFAAQAQGLGTTLVPSIVGFGAVLGNISDFVDNQPMAATIAGATTAWMVIWSFLSGGVIDRYARQRPTHATGFFAACGLNFWRFLRLGVLAWLVYGVLFALVHPWIFEILYPGAIGGETVERTALVVRAICYVIFGTCLVVCNLVFDYARIRIVVEDRHSAIGALIAATRFVRRHPATLALYLLNAGLFLALALVYAIVAPGAPQGAAILIAFGVGQIYILLRHYVKLLFYASQTAYFQGALAHAAYTASPTVVWPESPAAETIAN
jgi:hypothetical protein